jgi:UDP-N-acetylglucosamine 2-epimerase
MTFRLDGTATLGVCYGTRPQVVKASLLIEVLGERWELLTVDTGQHYDYELNALLYEQLGVRPPHFCLEVGSDAHAVQTGAIMVRAAEIFQRHRPGAVVVIGDTNSTLGCALAAVKLRVPVIHVEAGLRAADALMAEEINRRVVDAVSHVLCTPSADATRRMRVERPDAVVVETGDVSRDVLLHSISRVPPRARPARWPLPVDEPFVFSTMHRAELVDHPARLRDALAALAALDLPVILATHPRTREALRTADARVDGRVRLLPPLGYLETLGCIRDAAAVVTDSGGVQREAYWLGSPCVTLRTDTEWQETVQLGANVLVSPERAGAELPAAVDGQRRRWHAGASWDRDAYGAGDAVGRVRLALECCE